MFHKWVIRDSDLAPCVDTDKVANFIIMILGIEGGRRLAFIVLFDN